MYSTVQYRDFSLRCLFRRSSRSHDYCQSPNMSLGAVVTERDVDCKLISHHEVTSHTSSSATQRRRRRLRHPPRHFICLLLAALSQLLLFPTGGASFYCSMAMLI